MMNEVDFTGDWKESQMVMAELVPAFPEILIPCG